MKNGFLVVLLFFIFSGSFAQSQNAISKKINNQKLQNAVFKDVKLFHVKTEAFSTIEHIKDVVKIATVLEFKKTEAEKIIHENPGCIFFTIPLSANTSIELELTQSSIVTPDFKVITSRNEGTSFNYKGCVHYQGIIKGDNTSIVAISIFENEVMGIISSPVLGNLVLGKIKDNGNDLHILYNDKDLLVSPSINCFTSDVSKGYDAQQLIIPSQISTNCIRIYWEMNYDIFLDKGNVNNTVNYALGLFNESATLYNNDNIPVELSQVFVWDTVSPYTGSSSINLLNQFQAYRNSFTSDIGALLGYDGSGGVAAGINGLCSPNLDYSQCYAGVSGSFQTVPTYSWSVEVITHEEGHLLGSRHTHGCVWNGNNTAIDGCGPSAGYPYEGSCSGAPIPSGGGTIMSYCHLTSAGINFSNGFGSQPAAVILNNFNNASCLSSCTGGVFCNSVSGMTTNSITTTSAVLNWAVANGAVSYWVRYRIAGTTTWTLDSTLTNSHTALGLTPGTNYEWQVQTACSGNNSGFTSSTNFITIPLVCNAPAGSTTSYISSVSATFNWTAAVAAIGYNIQYRQFGTLTWTNATTVNISYHAVGLIPNTDYEWQVQTICAGGGTSVYSTTINFTTLDAGAPVTVVLQPDAACGKDALIGDNVPTSTNINNYGDDPEFNALAWTAQGNPSNHRSLIEFDLSFIPVGSAVSSAYLSFYWNTTSQNPGHSNMSGPNNAILSAITSPWSEYTVTWVNQPGTTTLHQALLPASTSNNQDYLNIDVTDMVQDFVNSPTTNYGMMIREATESAYRSLVFASSDNVDPNLHPKLELTYAPNKTTCLNLQYSNCEGVDALIGDCILAGYDTLNFGDNPEFDALSWTYSGTRTDLRSLIYWNLSAIPTNAVVNSATLNLFWNPNSANTGHSNQSGQNNAEALKITSPWSENTLTWNTQPTTDTLHKVLIPASTSIQQDYAIDVTNLVQDMISTPSTNYGLMIKLINENYFRSLIFCSSDHPDPARHPRLDICYDISNSVSRPLTENNISINQDLQSQTVFIRSTNIFEKGMIVLLYSSDGNLVSRYENLTGNLFTITKSNFAPGIYFVQLIGKSNLKSGKVLFR